MATKPLHLSNSKVSTYQRCEKKYEFRYIKKLRAKKKAFPLELGSWLHELLMTYYDGEDIKKVHRENTEAFNELPDEEKEDLGDLPREAARIMRSYLRFWREEDALYRTIDSELDETVTLPNGAEFQFIIDHIIEDMDGGLWLRDHKSVSRFLPPDFMLLDAQLTRYFYCAERLGIKPLMGVEFNQILTVPPTVPEVLKSGRLTERQNLRSDYWTYLDAIKKLRQDPNSYRTTLKRLRGRSDDWFRRSALPKDKPVTTQMMADLDTLAEEIKATEILGEFPRNGRKECTWDCEFLEPCVLQLQGGDISDVVKLRYVKDKKGKRDKRANRTKATKRTKGKRRSRRSA